MKGTKEDRELSELFRQKLGNAEVIPSPGVSRKMMRKLARREFFHFNPSRLNVWYTGGVAVVGAVIALILTSDPRKDNESLSRKVSTGINISAKESESNQNVISTVDVSKKEESLNLPSRTNIGSEKTEGMTEVEKGISKIQQNTGKIVTPTEVPKMPDTGLFNDEKNEMNKLQGIMQVGNLIGTSVVEGCTPLKVIFTNKSVIYDSCKWTFGDGGYSYKKNPEWIFDVEGDYEVILQVFGKEGRQSFSSVFIKVHQGPVARFEISPENAIIPDDEVAFLNYSSGAEKYRWDFGDGNISELFEPKHTYSRYGDYNVRLIAYSAYGCSDSVVIQNAFGSGYYIRFPNAFIPNPNGPSGGYYSNRSDEYANVFHPVYSGVSEYQMRIFSRRGILVFESNDVNVGWDGYYKGQLVEPGVYIWKVRGSYINGEPFTLMGDVTLLKSQ